MEANSENIKITSKLLAILVVAVIAFMVYMMFSINILDTARDAPYQQYSSCIITDKTVYQPARSAAQYLVESSCGKFSTDQPLWESLEVQKTYELTVAHEEWPGIQNIVQANQ